MTTRDVSIVGFIPLLNFEHEKVVRKTYIEWIEDLASSRGTTREGLEKTIRSNGIIIESEKNAVRDRSPNGIKKLQEQTYSDAIQKFEKEIELYDLVVETRGTHFWGPDTINPKTVFYGIGAVGIKMSND